MSRTVVPSLDRHSLDLHVGSYLAANPRRTAVWLAELSFSPLRAGVGEPIAGLADSLGCAVAWYLQQAGTAA